MKYINSIGSMIILAPFVLQALGGNESGLPDRFYSEAMDSFNTTKASSVSEVISPLPNKSEVKRAFDEIPQGNYIGKIPEELYIQLSRGEEGAYALELIQKWEREQERPRMSFEGNLEYELNSGVPLVITKPVQLTTISLQEGERLKDVFLGDSLRWGVEATTSGESEYMQTHLILKAKVPNVTTSMIISTNRRVYRMQVVSSNIFHMPSISFRYPYYDRFQEAMKSKLENEKFVSVSAQRSEAMLNEMMYNQMTVLEKLDRIEKNFIEPEMPDPSIPFVDPATLNFEYEIEKKGRKSRNAWMPREVFDDGYKVYIVMPEEMNSFEAPVVLLKNGKLREMVNYRLVGNKFIIDRLFNEAVLISDVGRNKAEIIIRRDGFERYSAPTKTSAKSKKKFRR